MAKLASRAAEADDPVNKEFIFLCTTQFFGDVEVLISTLWFNLSFYLFAVRGRG